jgi:hypothetical protein
LATFIAVKFAFVGGGASVQVIVNNTLAATRLEVQLDMSVWIGNYLLKITL